MSIYLSGFKYVIQFSGQLSSQYDTMCQPYISFGWAIPQIPNRHMEMKCVEAIQMTNEEDKYTYNVTYQLIEQQIQLPDNFTWTDVNGTNYVAQNIQQHNADCYIFATLQMAMSRQQIIHNNPSMYQNDPLSAQYVLDCNYMTTGTNGGMISNVIDFGQIYGFLRDGQYQSYTGNKQSCQYTNIDQSQRLYVNNMLSPFGSYEGKVNNMYEIQKEILSKGPVVALMSFNDNYKNGSTNDNQTITASGEINYQYPYYYQGSHYVLIVGWYKNISDNQYYWMIQDSKFEGDGYRTILAGHNIYSIESYISTLNIIEQIEEPVQETNSLTALDIGLIIGLCVFGVISIILATVIIIDKSKQLKTGYTHVSSTNQDSETLL